MNYKIDFKNPEEIHFIGIGGISMSGLAEILMKEGFSVTGSDSQESELTRHLISLGAKICYGQRSENITDSTKIVVYTAAVKPDNPEYHEAWKRNLPLLSRAELLGQIMEHYKTSIGISGTHGKTSTTSMLSGILLDADEDPTISIGGIFQKIHGNIRVGGSNYFITEACEYTNSFLSFYPTIGIILNICADHLDFFKDLDDIRYSFREYARHIPKNGTLIIYGGIEKFSYITEGLPCRIITFGLNRKYNYSASDIRYDDFACGSFDLMKNGEYITRINLKVTGEHNILNALASISAASEIGIPFETIKSSLAQYQGADRRFQVKGTINGVTIIDDYAHHPDEIQATLTAAQRFPHKKLWCVFQPHTYTRTKALLKEFAKTLSLADAVILAEIYPARETDTLGISSADLESEIKKLGKEVYYFHDFTSIEKFLLKNCINGDVLITMGAGNIVNVGENLLSK